MILSGNWESRREDGQYAEIRSASVTFTFPPNIDWHPEDSMLVLELRRKWVESAEEQMW